MDAFDAGPLHRVKDQVRGRAASPHLVPAHHGGEEITGSELLQKEGDDRGVEPGIEGKRHAALPEKGEAVEHTGKESSSFRVSLAKAIEKDAISPIDPGVVGKAGRKNLPERFPFRLPAYRRESLPVELDATGGEGGGERSLDLSPVLDGGAADVENDEIDVGRDAHGAGDF